jgi:formamidopyrimidine-DNA glycosylase
MEPTPKKRRRGKGLIVDMRNNTLHVHPSINGSPRKEISKRKPIAKNLTLVSNSMAQSNNYKNHVQGRFSTTADEDEEFRLTMQEMGRKEPFGIFRDEEVPSPGR